jgi:hypothetical protein
MKVYTLIIHCGSWRVLKMLFGESVTCCILHVECALLALQSLSVPPTPEGLMGIHHS